MTSFHVPFHANIYFQTLGTRAREWKDDATKESLDRDRFMTDSRGWEICHKDEEEKYATSQRRVRELENIGDDIIEECMEFLRLYSFLDEHDDDIICSTIETAWKELFIWC